MRTAHYPFQLGSLKCLALSDGSVNYPPGHLFANVSKARIEQTPRGRGKPVDYITTPCTCLYINTGVHRVLADMGAGKVAPGTGHLRNMAAVGIEPASVDKVVITHAHLAHVGGTLDERGELVYAKAHYYISRQEWDFWFSKRTEVKTPAPFVACACKNLEARRTSSASELW